MAKKSMIAKANRPPKFRVRAHNRCKICGRPAPTYASSACAVSASARMPSPGGFPVSSSQAGNYRSFEF